MHYHTMTNEALLGALIGNETAAAAYQGSLRPLFEGSTATDQGELAPLRAARELVQRWLIEEMEQRDVLASPAIVKDFLLAHFAGQTHESFVTLYLDAQHRVIVAEESFRGTLTQTAVYPREIVRRALVVNAGAVLFAHNHPSGVAEPSRADEFLTSSLKAALSLVDVRVLDHLVVAGPNTVSLAERGMI